MISKTSIEEKIKEIAGKPWQPVEIGVVNDQIVRLALFDGKYHWHKHENEDEFFLIYKGKIIIQLKDQEDINLKEGETATIPKNTEHCPKSVVPSYILMFGPKETKSTP